MSGAAEVKQPAPPVPDMSQPAAQPLEPTKPPDIDPETTASAANAVEQWRNYQNAYSAYQQQCAAYQNYIQQTQYAQTVEQQQMIYSQYLEQHRHYQYHLQQYEQYKVGNGVVGSGGGGSSGGGGGVIGYPSAPGWQTMDPMQGALPGSASMMPAEFQQPIKPTGPGGAGAPANGTLSGRSKGGPNMRRGRDSRAKAKPNEKKNELHTKTIIYLNPDDEQLLPTELKQLFGEFHCNLCRTRMNSHISANIHYQSKAHEKKINQWLKEYCAETGTPVPVRQRPPLELAADTNAIGKSVFHCEACDLVLTSVQHANQHYTGKRHAMVVNGKKLPSGTGHYNAEGKWIRTTKIVTEVTPSGQTVAPTTPVAKKRPFQATQNGANGTTGAKNLRLEPPPQPPVQLTGPALGPEAPNATNGVAAVPPLQQLANVPPVTAPVAATPVPTAPQPIVTINVESDEEVVAADGSKQSVQPATAQPTTLPSKGGPESGTTLEQELRKKEGLDCVDDTGTFCLICETSVTSRSEMLMHLKGAKHLKKARSMGVIVRTTPFNASDTILRSLSVPPRQTDWSLYRMPSGKFYCKTCNLIVADEKLFGQHWYGKKHKLKQRQEQQAEKQQQQLGGGTAGMPNMLLPGAASMAMESSFVSDDHDVMTLPVGSVTDLANPAGVMQIAPASDDGPGAQKALPKKGRRPYFKRGRFGKQRPAFPQ
uniref:C2H2-type domain-containing protein n=1 Tax=Anopheles quadriannulatus TaxID=34691 RepID=A0A182X3E4_ANOQN